MEGTQQSPAPLGASTTQPNTAKQSENESEVHPTPAAACPAPQQQQQESPSDTDDTEDQAHADDSAGAAAAAGIAETAALGRLGAAIARVDDPFFCSNEVTLPGPISILLKNKYHPFDASSSRIPLKVPASFIHVPPRDPKDSRYLHMGGDPCVFESHEAMAKLRASRLTRECERALRHAFEVSPFGRGNQTVVDASVRKAMQVSGASLVVRGFFFFACLCAISLPRHYLWRHHMP